jgi:hypothetical protein
VVAEVEELAVEEAAVVEPLVAMLVVMVAG